MKKTAFGVLLCLSLSAVAQSGVDATSGNYYWEHCAKNDAIAECITQVAGIFEGIRAQAIFTKSTVLYCLPPNATFAQGIDVVRKYIAEHPETRNLPLSMLVYGAMINAFPCPGSPTPENKQQ